MRKGGGEREEDSEERARKGGREMEEESEERERKGGGEKGGRE